MNSTEEHTTQCRWCSEQIYSSARVCSHCERPQSGVHYFLSNARFFEAVGFLLAFAGAIFTWVQASSASNSNQEAKVALLKTRAIQADILIGNVHSDVDLASFLCRTDDSTGWWPNTPNCESGSIQLIESTDLLLQWVNSVPNTKEFSEHLDEVTYIGSLHRSASTSSDAPAGDIDISWYACLPIINFTGAIRQGVFDGHFSNYGDLSRSEILLEICNWDTSIEMCEKRVARVESNCDSEVW